MSTFTISTTGWTNEAIAAVSFLQNPTMLLERMVDLDLTRFYGDKLLGGRSTSPSLAVAWVQNTELFPDEPSEVVAPGAAIKTVGIGGGKAMFEKITKNGIGIEVPVEDMQMFAMDPVDQAARRLKNQMMVDWDNHVLARIEAGLAHAQTVAGTTWKTGDAKARAMAFMTNIGQAMDVLTDANMGYRPNMMIISRDLYRSVVSNDELLKLLGYQKGRDDAVIDKGMIQFSEFPDLQIYRARGKRFTDPVIYDTNAYGSIVSGPGSEGDAYNGLKVTTRHYNDAEQSPGGGSDVIRVTLTRQKAGIVREPTAAVKITGVA
ncbi:hypothetical protein [Stomatohabitans albus]|uniref:hypothetical protein n=1 Tax=Stomatohabitans albus TaxID=3110766 RepID=UPI00300C2166